MSATPIAGAALCLWADVAGQGRIFLYFCTVKEMIFHMKQFDLRQERSAMKTGTDGVLLGAWCRLPEEGTVLDIGTGTGLIALMTAQRSQCSITGIEIDPTTAEEATMNAASSPWSERVRILAGDAMKVAEGLPCPDVIVSNPPFFKTTLRSPDARRSEARHGDTLTVDSLIELAAERLAPHGQLSLIAPADRLDDIEMQAAMLRLNMQRICMVKSAAHKPAIRVMVQMGRDLTAIERSEMAIRDAAGEYTPEYRKLTNEFYTHI